MTKMVAVVVGVGIVVLATIAAVVLKGSVQPKAVPGVENGNTGVAEVVQNNGVTEEDYQMEDLDAELSDMEKEFSLLEQDLKSLD